MKIALLEPFFTGSHKHWAQALEARSSHEVRVFSMSGKYWKWRTYIGAVHLAQSTDWMQAFDGTPPDAFLATSMLDVNVFRSLLPPNLSALPIGLYFHENQLTYPWSPADPDVTLHRDNHYAFRQFTSALSADMIFFNSHFHERQFFEALPDFLRQFPDARPLHLIDPLRSKSLVLPIGLDLPSFNPSQDSTPHLIWNHRWEYDKNPEEFFGALISLKNDGFEFKLSVAGEKYADSPRVFEEARNELHEQIYHWGYVDSRSSYIDLLHRCTHLPVTSNQDFFGISVVEAIAAGITPLMPDDLAYLEHVSDPSCFYKRGDFRKKLVETLMRKPRSTYRAEVEKYDWTNILPLYDQALTALCEIRRHSL